MDYTKEEKVALTIATDYNFGVSIDDMVDFGNKYEGSGWTYQRVIHFTENVETKLKPVAKKYLIENRIDISEAMRILRMELDIRSKAI